MVVWQMMRVVLGGLGVGVVLTIGAVSIMVESLPNLEEAQGWVSIIALLILALVAAAAAIVPARRAVSLTPTVALRSE
jgi:ABC-type antimicrobial peptide transport system permease subunit